MSSSDLMNNRTLVKSVSAGVFAGVVDKMFIQGPNANSTPSAVFGTSVGMGILITSLITQQIPLSVSDGFSSGVVNRTLEIAGTSASTYVVHNKIAPMFIKSVRLPEFKLATIGVVAGADIFGEMVYQWVSGGKMTLFA